MKSIKYLSENNTMFGINDIDGYEPKEKTRKQLERDWITVANWYRAHLKGTKSLKVSLKDIEHVSFLIVTELLLRDIPFNVESMKDYAQELFQRVINKLNTGKFDTYLPPYFYEDYVAYFAKWDTAYINTLPDSSFMWVEPGGTKDESGRTVPRSLRHLPFKDHEGKVDAAHVRNALARLNQVKDKNGKLMPASLQKTIRNKLEKILATLKKTGRAEAETRYQCVCLDCGTKFLSDKHCEDVKCSKCGGPLRRVDRPGIGKDKSGSNAPGSRREMEDFELEEQFFGVARVFGHPTGKMWFIRELIKQMQEHKKYVEPFAGSATIYFAKKPEETAVLNDLGDYSKALRYLQTLKDHEIKALSKKGWKSTPRKFKQMQRMKPKTKVDWLYKFTFVQRFSFGCMRKQYDKTSAGAISTLRKPERWIRVRDRLKNAKITAVDYAECVKAHDGPDTFFYLDPPYYDTKDKRTSGMNLGEISLSGFVECLKGIKGKFICTIGDEKEWLDALKEAGFEIKRIKTKQATAVKYNPDNTKKDMMVPIISNFPLVGSDNEAKAEGPDFDLEGQGTEAKLEREDVFTSQAVHSLKVNFSQKRINGIPSFLELTGILFHKGMHKGVMYDDSNLKLAKLKPRDGENLVYVNEYHKGRQEAYRVGILTNIWWNATEQWYCPNNKMKGKGALMYRSVVTEPSTIKNILDGKIGNVSAELRFDTYLKAQENAREHAAHIEVGGQAITGTPALPAADIQKVCTTGPDGEKTCQEVDSAQVK